MTADNLFSSTIFRQENPSKRRDFFITGGAGVLFSVGTAEASFRGMFCLEGHRELRWRAALLLCTTTPSAPAQPCVISPSVKPLKTERLDSSLLRGSRGRSRAVHRFTAVALPLQDVPRPAAHLNISPKGRNISHAQSAYFTAPQARFHTAAKLPYITAAAKPPLTPCSSPSARKRRCRA